MNLDRIIASLRPARDDEAAASAAIAGFMKRFGYLKGARACVGGSFAKGTALSGRHDIDIFVCFNYRRFSKNSAGLSGILAAHLRSRKIGFSRVHGSRDYFEVRASGRAFEVVPILDVARASQALNITDVSMLHAVWVKRKIGGKLADDVRLLKAFCAAHSLYGAESHVRGLSGYACEILIAHYGSFRKAVAAISRWQSDGKVIIDPSGFYRGRNPLQFLNSSKTQGPLVVIDPVDRGRNASASLSDESYGRLKAAASAFMAGKSRSLESFFTEPRVAVSDIKKKASGGRSIIVLEASPFRGRRDVVLSKVVKVSGFFRQQLLSRGFRIYDSGIVWQEPVLLWFETDSSLPPFGVVSGPPLSQERHAANFRRIYKSAFVRGKRLFASVRREFTSPVKLAEVLAGDDYVRERCSRVVLRA